MTEFMNALYQGDLSRQMRLREERRRAIGPDVMPAMSGDREALGRVAQQDPDVALKIASTIQGMDVRRAAQARSNLELAGRLASGVLLAPPDQQPTLYASALEQARALGLDTSKYPPAWGPAAKAWLQHSATMMGSISSNLKRIGAAGAPSGGGAPTGGFGGPRLPAAGVAPPVRTSDATPPAAPPVTLASAPPPAEPPQAPPMRVAGAGPIGGDLPPMPQIASATPPPVTPAIPPSPPAPRGPSGDDLTDFSWGGAIASGPQGAPKPDGTATAEMRVQPQRLAMLGADFVVPKDQRTADEFGLAPGEMYGTKKNGEPIVEGGWVLVRTRERGDVFRRLPKVPAEPIEAVGGGDQDPAIQALRGFQPPPGWAVARQGGKIMTADGIVQLVKPGPNFPRDPKDFQIAFVPLPQRTVPADPRAQTVDLGDRIGILGPRGDIIREIPKGAAPRSAPVDPRAQTVDLGDRIGILGPRGEIVREIPKGAAPRSGPTDRVPPGYEPNPNGPGLRPIPGGPADAAQAKALADAKRQENAKTPPASVIKGMTENLGAIKQVDRALALLAKRPASIGGPGSIAAANVPGVGMFQNWIDKDGTEARALIANIGSLIIHQRSGAAVTASEFPRLRPFIPTISDDAETARKKLEQFKVAYLDEMQAYADTYNMEGGFRPHKPTMDYLARAQGGSPPNSAAPTSPSPAGKPPEVPKGRADDLRRQYGLD